MSLPYELDGHAHDDAERIGLDIEQRLNREAQKIAELANWRRYEAFQRALFDELAGEDWGTIDWNGDDAADFKDALRTAWENSQKP